MAQAIDIVVEVASELSDSTYILWSKAELTEYLNDAQRQIALVRPDAASSIENITLVAGTKQAIPTTARRLLDIVRNMGAGATPGKPIRVVEEESLNLFRPTWHSDTEKSVIKNYTYDERTPDTFYVYPPAVVGTVVEAKLANNPTEITNVDIDAISLNDVYISPIRDWMLHRAYSKETDSSESRSLAASHRQAFYAALGIKTKVDVSASPSVELKQEGIK